MTVRPATVPAVIRTKAWFKPLAHLPMLGWRLGLEPVVGWVSMILTTKGRKSGLPRHTMVMYTELEGRKYVVAAYGPRSDWLRNIEADPRVTIQTARGVQSALARRVIDEGELLLVYDLMRRAHPLILRAYLATQGLPDEPGPFLAGTDRVAVVTFDPAPGPTPPPMRADLSWLSGLLPPLLLWRMLRRPR